MIANCRHCGYRINPYTGNCQNKMCEPRPAPVVDADALTRAIALKEENRRKSEETMRELYVEAGMPYPEPEVSRVATHLKSITNQKLWGSLAR